MSAGSLPSGLTRGYAKSFKDMLVETATKVLTIKDLNDLDDAELAHDNAVFGLCNQIDSDHETPAAA